MSRFWRLALYTMVIVQVCFPSSLFADQAVAQPRIRVGKNVHVSRAFQNQTHDEVLVAADPADPQHLIGCSDLYYPGADLHTVVYATFDGGLTWRPTMNAHYGDEGDPACAIGRNNLAYFATLGTTTGRDGEIHGMTEVYTSRDGGRSWPHRVVLPSLDREYLTVDTTDSKFSGHLYLNATGGATDLDAFHDFGFTNGIDLYHSIDNGASFEQPQGLLDVQNRYVLGMGNGAVLSDGTYVALFGDLKNGSSGWSLFPTKANAWLKVVRSTDGGQRFANATIVDDWHFCNVFTSSAIPMITSDQSRGPFHDRLYAAWGDARSGRCEIYVAHSSDKGKSWSPPLRVNDDSSLADLRAGDNFMPLVAVNKNGVVGVAWYDRREFREDLGYRVRFAASFDGGDTFTPSVPVSGDVSSLTRGNRLLLEAAGSKKAIVQKGFAKRLSGNVSLSSFAFIGGHTAGIAADAGGTFHPFWIDNRTGRDQVWTARVDVDGSAIRNGDPALTSLHDVTGKISLELWNAVYDRRSHLVTVQASVKNASHSAVRGPIRMRALAIASGMGIPSALNADNGMKGAGAVWSFEAAGNGSYTPDAHSAPRTLSFALSHAQTLRTDPTKLEVPQFVQIDAVMLAPSGTGGG